METKLTFKSIIQNHCEPFRHICYYMVLQINIFFFDYTVPIIEINEFMQLIYLNPDNRDLVMLDLKYYYSVIICPLVFRKYVLCNIFFNIYENLQNLIR